MRLLLVTRNFPPLVGGMERLIYNVYRNLGARCDVALVGPAGCDAYAADAFETVSIPLSPLWRFLAAVQVEACRLAMRLKPDIVLSGSGLTAPAAVAAARLSGSKAVCFVHGLDLVADSRIYRALFLPAIARFDRLVANSNNTAGLARSAGVDARKVVVLPPGVSIPAHTESEATLRQELGASGRPMLLSVGRLSARKGLADFVRDALPRIASRAPSVLLVVIGDEPRAALRHARGERERILEAAEAAGMSGNVRLLGQVDDRTLAAAYAAADLFVFPVLEVPGDVEGFGMVALEAAAHGLPTVAFSAGGVPDAVRPGVSGYLVPPGDHETFARVVADHLETQSRRDWRERCTRYAEQFAWHEYDERLRRVLGELASA